MASNGWLSGSSALLLVIAVSAVPEAYDATITIINGDAPGEGFNDPSPPDRASSAGGNPGTTLGEQRLNAFTYAAEIWSPILRSAVPIEVYAAMDPLPCTPSSAVLGSAGPQTIHRDFAEAPESFTWYVQAQANSLAGIDLAPEYSDLGATFSSVLGTTCPSSFTWYYGLDGRTPTDAIDFVTVVLHELTHGLGFWDAVDPESGAFIVDGRADAFVRNLEDGSTGLHLPEMTDAERAAAIRNTGNLHWIGASVVPAGSFLTHGRQPSGRVEMYAPDPPQVGSSIAHFSDELAPNELMEPFYTSSNHAPGLAAPLFEDLGWLLNAVPSIRVNDTYTTLTIDENTPLTIDSSLAPGVWHGQPADWWVLAQTPAGSYWLTRGSVWIRSDRPIAIHQGPLFSLPSYLVSVNAGLQAGKYKLYFGVDLLADGELTLNQLFVASLGVIVESM